MRTPRYIEVSGSKVYQCELENCLFCSRRLVNCNYLSGCKTVQTMSSAIEIAYRPKRCPEPDCIGHESPLRSAGWQQIAPLNCTYGFDVIATIGWQRQTNRQIYADIHAELVQQVSISPSQVPYLYNIRYLPLLACHERQNLDELHRVSTAQGLVLSLDGLAPEGGEPQLWLVREMQTGLTVRSGWMSEQSQIAFENFLSPIVEEGLRVTAIVSDKQRGLVPAIGTVFPAAKHGYCQAHYLNNIADPVATADEGMKVSLRKTVRQEVGAIIRPEQVEKPGVLMVTGLIPSPMADENSETSLPEVAHPAQDRREHPLEDEATTTSPTSAQQEREDIITAFKRRVRYLLTLKGRPPFRLAGLEMYQRLTEVVACLDDLLAHMPDETLIQLQQGLKLALKLVEADYLNLEQVASWLTTISDLLDPEGKDPRTAETVKADLFAYLEMICHLSQDNPVLLQFATQIKHTTLNYRQGLFHTYDWPLLPRTNNDRESEFRDLKRRLLRTTGQIGGTKRIIQRSGAWELIPILASFEETVAALSQVDHDQYQQERLRISIHRSRFKFHSRSAKQSQKQLLSLKERWLRLAPP